MRYKPERYHRGGPGSEPSRYKEAIEYQKCLQLGNAYEFPAIHRLRRNKEFQHDKHHIRHIIGIPQEGYGIREAKRKLGSWVNAYLDCRAGRQGAYKKQNLAGAWLAMISAIWRFAEKYPLSKNQPMPLHLAFEEIVYKRPKPELRIKGYFDRRKETVPKILLEDAETEAPQPIKRMVSYALRGDQNVYTERVRIFNRVGDSGCWEIRQIS